MDHLKLHPSELLQQMRERRPLVQCLQNMVSMDITANLLLALGASPAMVSSPDETPEFLPKADVLYVNMGTLTPQRIAEIEVATREAQRTGKPWVLDPVACGSTSSRKAQCVAAMQCRPTIVRGNASEIVALAEACAKYEGGAETSAIGVGKGPDSMGESGMAVQAAMALARAFGCVVAVSGKEDWVTDGERCCVVSNGVALLTRVTGVGCALSALAAAFLALHPEMGLEAAVAGCAVMGVAAEGRGAGAEGRRAAEEPGALRSQLMAEVYGMTPATLHATARIAFRLPHPPPQPLRPAPPVDLGSLQAGVEGELAGLAGHSVLLAEAAGCPVPRALPRLTHALASLLKETPCGLASPEAEASSELRGPLRRLGEAMGRSEGAGRAALQASLLFAALRVGAGLSAACARCQANGAPPPPDARAHAAALSSPHALQVAEGLAGQVVAGVCAGELGVEEAASFWAAAPRALAGALNEEAAALTMPLPRRRLAAPHLPPAPAPPHPTAQVGRVLVVAGSDSSGGAGAQADLKTCAALGAFAMTALTALTAQNTLGVQGVEGVGSGFVRRQIRSCLADMGADVIKTGMLPSAAVVEAVAEEVGRRGLVQWVVDPVLVATSGAALADSAALNAIRTHLFPRATLLTPNLPEAEAILGYPIPDLPAMHTAVRELGALGPEWVLLKGGHHSLPQVTDLLFHASSGETTVLTAGRVETRNTHGTGCTLASAVAALLAQGRGMKEAVVEARRFLWGAVRFSAWAETGRGNGALLHAYQTHSPLHPALYAAPRLHPTLYMGQEVDYRLYAVTDDACIANQGQTLAGAVESAIRGGASIVQLRQKNAETGAMVRAALSVKEVCARHAVPLLINDRLDVALAVDADGVHVGQEDMPCALARKLLGPHKIVGVSVKTEAEAAAAERDGADYLGSGAVFATSTKDSSAIGVLRFSHVCHAVGIPVVGIGGLTAGNCGEAMRAGAAGIAVVSAIFNQPDMEGAARELLAAVKDSSP